MYGAGRFLSTDNPFQAPAMAQQQAVPGELAAYQPNYSAFFNPQAMQQAGQPSFENPFWYGSTSLPPDVPPVNLPQQQQAFPSLSGWLTNPFVNTGSQATPFAKSPSGVGVQSLPFIKPTSVTPASNPAPLTQTPGGIQKNQFQEWLNQISKL